jgi:hypothetical protein
MYVWQCTLNTNFQVHPELVATYVCMYVCMYGNVHWHELPNSSRALLLHMYVCMYACMHMILTWTSKFVRSSTIYMYVRYECTACTCMCTLKWNPKLTSTCIVRMMWAAPMSRLSCSWDQRLLTRETANELAFSSHRHALHDLLQGYKKYFFDAKTFGWLSTALPHGQAVCLCMAWAQVWAATRCHMRAVEDARMWPYLPSRKFLDRESAKKHHVKSPALTIDDVWESSYMSSGLAWNFLR